jgi:hypothetical protein
MSGRLKVRGPDGSGAWHEGPLALLHHRLKIIDLSDAGAQPMVDDELGLVVVSTAASTTTGSCARSSRRSAIGSVRTRTPR